MGACPNAGTSIPDLTSEPGARRGQRLRRTPRVFPQKRKLKPGGARGRKNRSGNQRLRTRLPVHNAAGPAPLGPGFTDAEGPGGRGRTTSFVLSHGPLEKTGVRRQPREISSRARPSGLNKPRGYKPVIGRHMPNGFLFRGDRDRPGCRLAFHAEGEKKKRMRENGGNESSFDGSAAAPTNGRTNWKKCRPATPPPHSPPPPPLPPPFPLSSLTTCRAARPIQRRQTPRALERPEGAFLEKTEAAYGEGRVNTASSSETCQHPGGMSGAGSPGPVAQRFLFFLFC